MSKSAEFTIENDSDAMVFVYAEPESIRVPLHPNETVTVHDHYENSPVTIRVSREHSGIIALSIWPGDGDAIVMKNGCNVLDTPEDV